MSQTSNGSYNSRNQIHSDAIFSQDTMGVLPQENFESETPSAIHDLPQELLRSGFLSKRKLDYQMIPSDMTPKYPSGINTCLLYTSPSPRDS